MIMTQFVCASMFYGLILGRTFSHTIFAQNRTPMASFVSHDFIRKLSTFEIHLPVIGRKWRATKLQQQTAVMQKRCQLAHINPPCP